MKTLVIGLGRRGGDIAAMATHLGGYGVEVLFADTDADDLARRPEGARLRLGAHIPDHEFTRNDLSFAYGAASADREAVASRLDGADLVLLVAGLGGGTGSGGGKAVAEVARDLGLPTIALATLPFDLEGEARVGRGRLGLRVLRDSADLTVPFAQDVLVPLVGRFARVREVMAVTNEFLCHAIAGVHSLAADIGTGDGLESLLETSDAAAFTYGVADEPEGLVDAVRIALAGPFLQGLTLGAARGLGVSFRSREPLDRPAVGRALAMLAAATSREARLLVTQSVDEDLDNAIHLSVIATGDLGRPATSHGEIWVPGPSG